jgi:hypothetical protein
MTTEGYYVLLRCAGQMVNKWLALNIVPPTYTYRSPKRILPLSFCDLNFVWISHLSRTWYMLRSSHPPWFDRTKDILCIKHIMKLLLLISDSTILHSTLFSNIPSLWRWLSSGFLSRVVWQKFTDVSEVLPASIIRAIKQLLNIG